MKSILDPSFRYTPSVETDIRKTFARIRRQQEARKKSVQAEKAEADLKVLQLPISKQR